MSPADLLLASLARQLRLRRLTQDLSQAAVAQRARLSPGTISAVENGTAQTLAVLVRAAQGLGCRLEVTLVSEE